MDCVHGSNSLAKLEVGHVTSPPDLRNPPPHLKQPSRLTISEGVTTPPSLGRVLSEEKKSSVPLLDSCTQFTQGLVPEIFMVLYLCKVL